MPSFARLDVKFRCAIAATACATEVVLRQHLVVHIKDTIPHDDGLEVDQVLDRRLRSLLPCVVENFLVPVCDLCRKSRNVSSAAEVKVKESAQ